MPGISAFPQTRPSFRPAKAGEVAIHELFPYYAKIIAELYYPDSVEISEASYGIRKEAKIGLPFNAKTDEAHVELLKQLVSGKLPFDYAGQYIYGTRIQTDSNKIRNTGYIQLKAVGDGFSAQRHRMINAGPAINHLLGVFEFDYHHHWLSEYAASCNIVVDDVCDTGFAYAWDYKNYERSLGWDVLFRACIDRLRELGRYSHADLFEKSNCQCTIHYPIVFKNEAQFEAYLECGNSVDKYMSYVRELYGTTFQADDLVRETVKAIKDNAKDMREMFKRELSDKRSPISGYSMFVQEGVYNNSGVATTATVGKLYAFCDILCRLSEVVGKRFTKEHVVKLLKHELPIRVYNLGDDNMIICDSSFPLEKFITVKTGVIMTEELPVAFLSRRLKPEITPRFYKNAYLEPQAKSFYRKLSRERDIRSYHVPSEGWVSSFAYARRNEEFQRVEQEVISMFKSMYMGIDDIITDAREYLDSVPAGIPVDALEYLDNPGILYKEAPTDAVNKAPFLFFAITPATRQKIISFYN